MFGIGIPELLLIFIVVLIFVGPKKLPAAGAALGKALREFRASFSGDKAKAEEQTPNGSRRSPRRKFSMGQMMEGSPGF
jgi:sec-independent protein translocase protein TatA